MFISMRGMENSLEATPTFVERRAKPRLNCSYPALLRGVSSEGMRYEGRALLTNLSAGGMYLLTRRQAHLSEQVKISVRLATSPLNKQEAPYITASGSVVRVEPRPDGSYGVAVQLHSYRLP